MSKKRSKSLVVRFTKHQLQLMDRLVRENDDWVSVNELIVDALQQFAEQHILEQKGVDYD